MATFARRGRIARHGKELRSAERHLAPGNPDEVQEVLAQLDLLLHDPLFSQSRRYPSLLRRIVEDSLAGRTENLKERILGMEIFDRPADYDTNADAIVRVTAAEIRKRIAQYYHDQKHVSELRIDLPVGGYVAVFRASLQETPAAMKPAPELPLVVEPAEHAPIPMSVEPSTEDAPLSRPHRYVKIWGAMAAVVIALAVGLWLWPPDLFKAFWNPLVRASSPTVICVGQLPLELLQPSAPTNELGRALLAQKPVSISDTVVVSTFATFLGSRGIKPRILVSTQTSFSDLRNAPVLLVGGLDNSWTMRMLAQLRYRMESVPGNPTLARIYNSKNPEEGNWTLDFGASPKNVIEDYAVVARFTDHETEDTVLIAAGLGENGTSAAADFLTHPQYLKALGEGAPRNWNKMNVEAVLRTQVIEGKTGPAEVVAKYY